ncbi:uncharacterized protein THITE_152492 [Thermothielavioides terrestris NRRL 8126]|uniref:Uncharacterized protein n=1 Tax=Thermothielavioides terrestris (strain ATCC 38088 / NRRL 8126) TaxID=578455 RepID=G2R3W3_THETT|nr:uncharacterized protein THITE_152492 [Thermothielavioides terrestris NRRL 8126]AEO66018.1 hypothetical protein THITE_152492 [Thermothielavioides terrestris NRRL 8126]
MRLPFINPGLCVSKNASQPVVSRPDALMENIAATRRAASQGALDRGSSARAALQSLDGNAVFLASPSPLDGMLRKTTETGDIGPFSFGSVRVPRAFEPPARPRPAKPKTTNAGRSPNDGIGGDLEDDRRQLPSYRHSTSGSVSLCDSGSSIGTWTGDHGNRFCTSSSDFTEDAGKASSKPAETPDSPLLSLGQPLSPTAQNPAISPTPNEIRALFSADMRRVNGKALRRLKKCFPDLGARLAEAQLQLPSSSSTGMPTAAGMDNCGQLEANPTPIADETAGPGQRGGERSRRLRGRVTSWVASARRAIARVCPGLRVRR